MNIGVEFLIVVAFFLAVFNLLIIFLPGEEWFQNQARKYQEKYVKNRDNGW